MNDKYVAFLDILGYRDWMKKNDIYEATKYMDGFYNEYAKICDTKDTHGLSCFIVSDSIVVYTLDIDKAKLRRLIDLCICIAQSLFINKDILIRGAICKGSFEIDESIRDSKLFTGQAYVDAFLLEEKPKVAGIALSDDVVNDIDHHIKEYKTVKLKEYTLIRYITKNFLEDESVLNLFIDRANAADWLPHYHNTIYTVLYNNSKAKTIISTIINRLETIDHTGSITKKYFKTAFNDCVEDNYQEQLLTFIRNRLYENN